MALFPAPTIAGVISGSVDVSACGPGFNQSTTNPNFVSILGSDSGTIQDLQGPPGTIVSCSGHGAANASYGFVKISGDASGVGGVILDAGFQDFITMSAPGVANLASGTITYQIFISGLLHATDVIGGPQASASASWDLTAGVGGTLSHPNTDIHKCGELRNGAFAVSGYVNCVNTLQPGDSFGTYTATVPIQWGFGTLVSVRLEGLVNTDYDPPTGLTVGSDEDLSHSLYWSGITGATANGIPITNFTVTSQSGANYADSFVPAAAGVPEPDTASLIAGAIVTAGLIRKYVRR